MKNKFYLLITLLAVTIMQISCKKELGANNTRVEKLSAVTCKYQHYYLDFNKANTILAYFIYKPNNLMDMSRYRVKFDVNGTYSETNEEGTSTTGTWKFNADQTVVEMKSQEKEMFKKIYVLDETGLQWGSMDGNMLGILIEVK